ncbi:NRPS [Arthromyces matolae]|nr:NRPS [Arthromyces matolae]
MTHLEDVQLQRLLHGYSFVELPNLSVTRFPEDRVYSTQRTLNLSEQADRTAYVLVAISRILGAYCGTSDILLAINTDNPDIPVFIRVAWANSDSWNDVLISIQRQLQSNTPTMPSTIRRILDLSEQQTPALAMCYLSSQPFISLRDIYPLTFIYDPTTDHLGLTCSAKHLHASVSSQLLSQVSETITYVESHPTRVIEQMSLSPELMSRCERAKSDDLLGLAYPHLISVPLATDYLTHRSITHPTSTAFQWYSDLSSEASLDQFESLSYLSLHRKANQTARWLRNMGLKTEDRVGVCMNRDVLFHVALFGIMRAGGCYVPSSKIDPDLPSERKAYIARDAGARFVMTTAALSSLSLFGSCTLFFEEQTLQTAIGQESYDNTNNQSAIQGTTGNPKGCLLTNRGLSQATLALSSHAADVSMDDLSLGRYMAVASIAFDVHLAETFVPIALGMPSLTALRSQLLENLPFYVKHMAVTHIGIVPSLIEVTLCALSEENEGRDMALRYIASGGEKISDAVRMILDKWANHPKVRLANFYGPSEVTIGCCSRVMHSETPRANIGRSFANVAGYVVDENFNILPRGSIGELVVEGPLVGRGYIGRPDLTKKSFKEWPQKGDWAYCTGDLVRMMPDNTFEILGRIDSQIKLNGVRIESEGISSVIRQASLSYNDLSLDASTILEKHPSIGTEQLVSFIAWDASIPVSTRKSQKPSFVSPPHGLMKQIRLICQRELARYMRPSHIIPLSWLPLNSNGKTDTKALGQIFQNTGVDSLADLMAETPDGEVAPRPTTELEDAIFAILGRRAAMPRGVASPELSPFACGLDSMSVIQFAKELNDQFGTRITASTIMSTTTLAGIGALVQSQLLSHVDDRSTSFTAGFSSRWLNEIQRNFTPASVECILPPYGVQEGVLTRSVNDNSFINATLSEIPPFRLSFYAASKDERYLVCSIHHALYDGTCLPLLFQDVEREYHGHPLIPLAKSSDILDCIASVDVIKARDFWQEYYSGFDWPLSPIDSSQLSSSSKRQCSRQFKSTISRLKQLSALQGVTLQTILTSTFAVLAATRIYQLNDISFGIIRSGRLIPVTNVETAICPMVSVVPARIKLNSGEGNVLHTIQKSTSATIEVEHVPLGKVNGWVRPGQAMFDLLFSVSVKSHSTSDLWDVIQSQAPEADYTLAVEVVLDSLHDTLTVQAVWKAGELDDEVILAILDDFELVALDVGDGKIQTYFLDGLFPINKPQYMDRETSEAMESVADPGVLNGLRGIISEFLNVEDKFLTETASFISLGLDSIKSVGLARILKGQGHHIRAEELMKYSTLGTLAHRLMMGGGRTDKQVSMSMPAPNTLHLSFSDDEIKLTDSDEVTLFPTTTLQAGMLSQTISSNSGSLYIHAFPLQISSSVLLDTLEMSWTLTLESLDILRTSFHFDSNSGMWLQGVHSVNVTAFTKEFYETSEDYETKVRSFLDSTRITDESGLRTPPIWLRLFVPAGTTSSFSTPRLLLVMHHALYDGVSIDTLLETVQTIYLGVTDTTKVQAIQFHTLLPYILHQETHGTSFWMQSLSGFHHTPLPRRNVENLVVSTASRNFSCDWSVMSEVLRRASATLQCLGQAAFGKLLGELTGATDIVFGHTVSGRSIPNAERVIGPVLNTIPCRVRFLDGSRNVDVLRLIHRHNVDALPWQHASLRSIQRAMSMTSLWDSIFVFNPSRGTQRNLASLWSLDEEVGTDSDRQIQYALALEMHHSENEFVLKAACRYAVMSDTELHAALARFQTFFEHLVSHLDGLALADVAMKTHNIIASDKSTIMENERDEQIPELIKSLLKEITSVRADNFDSATPLATLGIDSITAIQIVARFRKVGLVLSTNDIITSRTVKDLVGKTRLLKQPTSKNPTQSSSHFDLTPAETAQVIKRVGASAECVEDVLPMSSGMKWLIGSWQSSGRTAFQHAFAFRLPAEVDVPKLRIAWKALLKQMPILRSTFASSTDTREARVVVFKPDSFDGSWAEEEISGREDLAWVASKMRELVSTPRPTTLPPTRALVCTSSGGKGNYLVLYLHHFQYDAWSLPLIVDDLSRSYRGLEFKASNNIHSFLEVAGPSPHNLSLQQQFWQRSFGDNFLPTFFPRLLSQRPENHPRTLYTNKAVISNASLCAERAKALGFPLSSAILACWARLQGWYCSSNSVTMGLWQTGRTGLLDDITMLAFPCLNILPMRIPVPEGDDITEIARNITNDLRERSPVVVQSDLTNIDTWIGANGRPLCNTVVNIIGDYSETTLEDGFLKKVDLPYYLPSDMPQESNPTIDRLAITNLIQNDLIIDFAVLLETDAIMVSIDADSHIMNDALAQKLIGQWADNFKAALDIEIE